MNTKEVAEIRRQFKEDKTNITTVCGCYVNDKKEILSTFKNSIALMSMDETEEILAILRKTLSGTIGKNLIDVPFSTSQVTNSSEHALLMRLNKSRLEDAEAVKEFFEKTARTVDIDDHFLMFLVSDAYDVPKFGKKGAIIDESVSVFNYILCCVCPIKITKQALGYFSYENTFKNVTSSTLVDAPVLGFMFPSFDDRATNIYNAMYYTKSAKESCDAFAMAAFGCELPMPAISQKQTFSDILTEKIDKECSLEVVEAFREELCNRVEEHKLNRERDTLVLDGDEVSNILVSCGVEKETAKAVKEKYEEEFGKGAELIPQNLMELKKISLENDDISIKVSPSRSDLVKTKIIDGVPYVMIRVEGNVSVNGVSVHIGESKE